MIAGALGIGGGEIKKTTIYDPAANAWTEGPLLNEGRGPVASAGVLNGKIYLVGGWRREAAQAGGNVQRNPKVNDMENTEELDPAANVWVKKADIPTGRYQLPPTAPVVGSGW